MWNYKFSAIGQNQDTGRGRNIRILFGFEDVLGMSWPFSWNK